MLCRDRLAVFQPCSTGLGNWTGMKTLLRGEPELKIDSKKDGVWLLFETGGLNLGVNLSLLNLHGTIMGPILNLWCEAYALQQKAKKKNNARDLDRKSGTDLGK